MASAICVLMRSDRMLDHRAPPGCQSHQCVDTGGKEPRQRACTVEPDHQRTGRASHRRGRNPRHDDSEEELPGSGLAPEGCQFEREREDFPNDGQRAGVDEHRGEIVLRIERAGLIDSGYGEHHLPIAKAGESHR